MKSLLLITALLVGYLAHAQNADLPTKQQMVNQVGQDGYMGAVQTYDNRYQGVKGSPFLSADWRQGRLEYADGKVYPNVPMKYDVYQDELWVKNQIQEEIIIFHHTLKSFALTLPDEKQPLLFIKARYIEGLTTLVEPEQMVQVLYDGDYKVVAERHKTLRRASYKGGYSQERYFDEFTETNPQYYLIEADKSVQQIKPKARAVLKAFAPHDDILRAFIKKHSLDIANPNDMTRLVGYYDQEIANEH